MQTDSTGLQQRQQNNQESQAPHLSREQEFNMDTSDDHAVERQLLVDLAQPSSQQEKPSIATSSAAVASILSQNFPSMAASLDSPTKEDKLPPSEYELLCEATKTDPHRSAAWAALIEHSERSKDIAKIRNTYDKLLDIFPNTVRSVSLLECWSRPLYV